MRQICYAGLRLNLGASPLNSGRSPLMGASENRGPQRTAATGCSEPNGPEVPEVAGRKFRPDGAFGCDGRGNCWRDHGRYLCAG